MSQVCQVTGKRPMSGNAVDKNKRRTPDKLEMKKFDPVIRQHVLYTEAKIK